MQKLKEILKKLIEEELNQTSVEISGSSLEEALSKASAELGVDISELDYEIKEFGSKGVFGLGKKDFVVNVYKSNLKSELFQNLMSDNMNFDDAADYDIENQITNKDSEAFLRVTSRGVLLKVTPPIGKGKKISESEILNIISTRRIQNFNREMVKKVLKNLSGEYTRIGEMPLNITADSSASVQVTSDEMKAYLVLTPPKPGGYDLEIDEISNILKSNNAVVGIKEDVLNRIIDYPIYNEPILIAEGIKPKNGKDAEIVYNFNTKDEVHFVEEDGKVDFKNLNIVQNVVAGQILAVKELATKGEPGRTISGKLIPQKIGKDCSLNPGKNTHASEDGLQIIADKNGQVLLYGGKVVVEEVYTVNGDVNLKVGNILFLGNVIINGNVEDGFSVKAAGNIEIHGSVGKCELDAEGDIIISQGVMGKNEGFIRAGRNIYAKFVENARVEAAEGAYIQDGVMHSYIDATKEIAVVGKRAAIVGGRMRAGELIKSKTIGSVSGTETTCEVGIDPKKRQTLNELEEEKIKAYKELEPLQQNLTNLENQKKVMKNLTPEKEELFKKLVEESINLKTIIKKNQEEIDQLNEYLANLKTKGRIIASKLAFPGVKIYIKSAYLQTKTEYKKVFFTLQGSEVNVTPYREEERER